MIEYKVRPVTRFVVTRYQDGMNASCECKGVFDNFDVSYQVAYALARDEHERLGLPLGDSGLKYPSSVIHQPAKQFDLGLGMPPEPYETD